MTKKMHETRVCRVFTGFIIAIRYVDTGAVTCMLRAKQEGELADLLESYPRVRTPLDSKRFARVLANPRASRMAA